MGIYIIFAPPGEGKTCFLAHCLNTAMYNRQRNKAMQMELVAKQQNGFKNIKTIPQYCVSANFDLIGKKFGYSPRYSRKINPYRLGFENKYIKTHFNLPYEVIGITEAQKYLNSRMSLYFPDWQSRWYEQHRHDNLDIYLDTQRPMLIDANIRELAEFIEIVKLSIDYDNFGKPCRLTWKIRRIKNSNLFDKYMSSGRQDKSCYTEEIVVANYNVFALYDSQSCKPKFYEGHFEEDIDYQECEPPEETMKGYIKYLEENDDELPKGFYQKRSLVA